MRISLIRHGETEANVARRIQGHGDSPLTPRGHAQCHALSHHLSNSAVAFTHMYVSDLGRAQTTASYLCTSFETDTRLRERRYRQDTLVGDSRQVDVEDAENESEEHVWKRALSMLCTIASRHSENDHVAMVSHGGWISCVLRNLGVPKAGFPRNASITTLDLGCEDGSFAGALRSGKIRVEIVCLNFQPPILDPRQRTLDSFFPARAASIDNRDENVKFE